MASRRDFDAETASMALEVDLEALGLFEASQVLDVSLPDDSFLKLKKP